VLARLLPPDPVSGDMGWGFELALRANEAPRIFALARARLIWAALRTSGLASRPRQFAGAGPPVSERSF